MRPSRHSPHPAVVVVTAIVAGLLVSAVLMDWLVVDIRGEADEGHHARVWIPVPVAALRTAAALLPEDAFPQEPLPLEVRRAVPSVVRLLDGLAEAPEGTLLSVHSPGGTVEAGVGSGVLVVDVVTEEATVHTSVPLRRLARSLERWEAERLDPRLVRALLAALDDGFEVTVRSPETRVHITVH